MELVAKNIYNGLDAYWENMQEVYTRRQIGEALGYKDPKKSMEKLHARHEKELNSCSGVVTLGTPGGEQKVFVYNSFGVIRICAFSSQPRAKELLFIITDRMQRTITAQQEHIFILESKIEPPKLETPKKTPEEILLTPPKWVNNEDDKERYRRLILFILRYFEENKPPKRLFKTYLREKCMDDALGPTNNIDIYRSAYQKAKKYYEAGGAAERVLEYMKNIKQF